MGDAAAPPDATSVSPSRPSLNGSYPHLCFLGRSTITLSGFTDNSPPDCAPADPPWPPPPPPPPSCSTDHTCPRPLGCLRPAPARGSAAQARPSPPDPDPPSFHGVPPPLGPRRWYHGTRVSRPDSRLPVELQLLRPEPGDMSDRPPPPSPIEPTPLPSPPQPRPALSNQPPRVPSHAAPAPVLLRRY
jgi:hypothetical protein